MNIFVIKYSRFINRVYKKSLSSAHIYETKQGTTGLMIVSTFKSVLAHIINPNTPDNKLTKQFIFPVEYKNDNL